MKKIVNWFIVVTWSDGKEEQIADMPNDVVQSVDNFLTVIEEERRKEWKNTVRNA